MTSAQINSSIIDMLVEPRFHAERVSQLFYGELVEVSESKDGFMLAVRMRDNYSGWIDARFAAESKMARGVRHRVHSSEIQITDPRSGRTLSPYRLFYGTEVMVTSIVKRKPVIRLLNGNKTAVSQSSLSKSTITEPKDIWTGILRDSQLFLGAPYLWGGISPLGCDCSGLVQTLFGQHGICLPRDTKEQRMVGLRVQRKEIRPGDLLFSPGHVAIALRGGEILHSSRAAGGVSIQSLNKRDKNYRKDLDEQFEEARRVVPITT